MTVNPETPDTEEVVEKTAAPAKKKPAKKRKPAAKKKATPRKKAAKPAEIVSSPEDVAAEFKENIDEAKERFIDATVEPAKEVVNTWAAIADFAADYAVNTKDGLRGWWDGFIANEKKTDKKDNE